MGAHLEWFKFLAVFGLLICALAQTKPKAHHMAVNSVGVTPTCPGLWSTEYEYYRDGSLSSVTLFPRRAPSRTGQREDGGDTSGVDACGWPLASFVRLLFFYLFLFTVPWWLLPSGFFLNSFFTAIDQERPRKRRGFLLEELK